MNICNNTPKHDVALCRFTLNATRVKQNNNFFASLLAHSLHANLICSLITTEITRSFARVALGTNLALVLLYALVKWQVDFSSWTCDFEQFLRRF